MKYFETYDSIRDKQVNGIEIFMMNVGDADCFLVIRYANLKIIDTTLIDGGNKSNAKDIVQRLKDLKVTHIDNVVNTHPHADHASGLIEIIKDGSFTFGEMWINSPDQCINANSIRYQLSFYNLNNVLNRFNSAIDLNQEIINACQWRGITIDSPTAGKKIGPFWVLGPSTSFYNECWQSLSNNQAMREWNHYYDIRDFQDIIIEQTSQDKPLGDDTSPINESSVVLQFEYNNKKYVFTGDAGCNAINDIIARGMNSHIEDIFWLESPHHGSRRNLSPELIDIINPNIVYISCIGSRKHPSRKLVNYFKDNCNSKVHATYYPLGNKNGWKLYCAGTTPSRNTSPSTELYE